jgi:glycosyltransferase involved in cell wall biosynthesis
MLETVRSNVNRPLLTIAVTCYNAADTLERAVLSALAQTWTPREIVVVDDGSTDGSARLLSELEEMHDEVRVVRHESNQGVAGARNTLLAHAHGTLIAYFDDDDESMADRLERQYRRLSDYVQTDRQRPMSEAPGIGRREPAPSGPIVADYVLGLVKGDSRHSWGMLGSGTLMVRTEALRALGGFDAGFRRCAERDLAVRAALTGAHFVSVDAPLVTQYLTRGPDKAGSADLRYRLLLLDKHRVYLKRKRSYAGAWCYMHAQSHRARGIRWRLWYLAALVLFPWRVSRDRLRASSLLARFRPSPARAASS